MALMLEALAVQPGQRILEIGTGSGYNAALLAQLTGSSGHVVTIERDGTLATRAAHTLARETGSIVAVVVGDGVAGWSQEAPYDRVLATASASTLPMAWIHQLRPEGKLVMDLQGTLASGFLVVEKTSERETGGLFLAEPLHFMPLKTEAISLPQANRTELLRQACQETFVLENDAVFPHKLFEHAFRWFLQWNMPGCQISTSTQQQHNTSAPRQTIVLIDPARHALLRFQKPQQEAPWQGKVYGGTPLWQELQQVYEVFTQLGEPPPQSYRLVIEQDNPCLLIGSLQLPLART